MIAPTPLKVRLKNLTELDKIALSDTHESLSYKQLLDKVDSLSRWLTYHHVATLALHADNSIDWVIVDLACHQSRRDQKQDLHRSTQRHRLQ